MKHTKNKFPKTHKNKVFGTLKKCLTFFCAKNLTNFCALKKCSKFFSYAVFLLLIASFVCADDLCTESDDGKDYAEQGHVKYGVIKYEDLCVLSPDADMRVAEGKYLKEYYCTDDDKREHKIVDCTAEGFEKCKDGRCFSSLVTNASKQVPVVVGPECGNKKVEANEDCDPPTKICFVGADIGLCSQSCRCEVKIHVDTETKPAVVNKTSEITSNQSKIALPVPEVAEKSAEDKDGISAGKDRLALPKAPKKGIFSRIWSWFFGLFD